MVADTRSPLLKTRAAALLARMNRVPKPKPAGANPLRWLRPVAGQEEVKRIHVVT